MASLDPTQVTYAPRIPVMRIDDAGPAFMREAMETVRRIAAAGAFTGGPEVEGFEREFAAWCGSEHAIGISSGTEALALALRALNIGPGDEVIVPANSFIATAEAVTLVGATPRFADVEPDSHLVSAATIEPRLTPRTRCIIPVHLSGTMVDLDPVMELARSRGIAVIEDACQAHGAWYGERRAGAIGDLGCFSFYPTKNLGAWGDGGAVTTSDPELAERVRLLRSHGESPRYHHHVPGTTARLDALQAAILRLKLRDIEPATLARRRAGRLLTEGLRETRAEVQGRSHRDADHVFHLFVVRVDDRERFRAHLEEREIATAIHYPFPIHLTGAYAGVDAKPGELPVVEALAERICTLPLFPSIHALDIERVVDACASFRPALSAI